MTVQEALRLYPEAKAWTEGVAAPSGSFARFNEATAGRAAQANVANTLEAALLVCEEVMRVLAAAYYALAEKDRHDAQEADRRAERAQRITEAIRKAEERHD
jgi:hypothetical protein